MCGVECVCGLLLVPYVKMSFFARFGVVVCLGVLFMMYRVVLYNLSVRVCLLCL